jgi:CheY-like chemotaxis protein
MIETPKAALAMQTVLLCSDVQFLGTTRGVLRELQVTPRVVSSCYGALEAIQAHEFDVIVLDWREIDSVAEFLCSLRRSIVNRDCVLVAIVRDLLDLRLAFTAGVHLLIHKPPSTLQIERCLRAAYSATVTRRRRHHREAVEIAATARIGDRTFAELTVSNLSSAGCGVQCPRIKGAASLSAGDELELQFALPETETILHPSGRVIWVGGRSAGIRFTSMSDPERMAFDGWLTECVERSLAQLCERLQTVCA